MYGLKPVPFIAEARTLHRRSSYPSSLKPVPFIAEARTLHQFFRSQRMATMETIERKTLGKVRPHQTQNEGLVFEKSSAGKRGYKLPPLDVPMVDAVKMLGAAHRETPRLLPELSEIEII